MNWRILRPQTFKKIHPLFRTFLPRPKGKVKTPVFNHSTHFKSSLYSIFTRVSSNCLIVGFGWNLLKNRKEFEDHLPKSSNNSSVPDNSETPNSTQEPVPEEKSHSKP